MASIPLYNLLPSFVNVPRSHVPALLAMQWSIAWRSAFYRGREHLWIVFSFNIGTLGTKSSFVHRNSKRTLFIRYFVLPQFVYCCSSTKGCHTRPTKSLLKLRTFYSFKSMYDKRRNSSGIQKPRLHCFRCSALFVLLNDFYCRMQIILFIYRTIQVQ